MLITPPKLRATSTSITLIASGDRTPKDIRRSADSPSAVAAAFA
jgi:hypothetical protein